MLPEDSTIQAKAIKHNSKVTVQYIVPIIAPADEEILEVDGIEYLEETANSEEYTEEAEFKDEFYPNAIHCLLDLYNERYKKFVKSVEELDEKELAQVWREIAKEMQDSYFEFEVEQVQQKYVALRKQYFDARTQEDIENFEYFDELHDIYKDPTRELISKNGSLRDAIKPMLYKDESLISVDLKIETQAEKCADFKSEEIVHKEHEFIDMVEKELQAMEDDKLQQIDQLEQNELSRVEGQQATHSREEFPAGEQNLKRPLDEDAQSDEPPNQKPKMEEPHDDAVNFQEPASPQSPADNNILENYDESHAQTISLSQYNEEQERRHREQLEFLDKKFQQHQNTLEQLNFQLQELIKRLPPLF